jgi:hypothetical protein
LVGSIQNVFIEDGLRTVNHSAYGWSFQHGCPTADGLFTQQLTLPPETYPKRTRKNPDDFYDLASEVA